jgi:addiction module HigA family antidote
VHPGEVLAEEFLRPLGLSASALARRIGVPGNRISEIAAGRRTVTGDTALRVAAAFGTSPEFWMNLQSSWELETARDATRDEDWSAMRVA